MVDYLEHIVDAVERIQRYIQNVDRTAFLANGGEGAGSLAYMNLSNGESSFTEVAELQDVNLKLLLNDAPDKVNWNTLFVLLRIDATNIPKADNLMADATAL